MRWEGVGIHLSPGLACYWTGHLSQSSAVLPCGLHNDYCCIYACAGRVNQRKVSNQPTIPKGVCLWLKLGIHVHSMDFVILRKIAAPSCTLACVFSGCKSNGSCLVYQSIGKASESGVRQHFVSHSLILGLLTAASSPFPPPDSC